MLLASRQRAIAREGSVRVLRHIWRDLRHGENVDLYPVIVISLVATVLSQLGLASQKLIVSLLLALVGLLAIAMLVNRRQNEQLTTMLSKLEDSTVLSQRFLRKEDRVDEVARRIRMAREVWLWGTTLSAHIPALEEVIRSNLEGGLVLRVLLVQPHSSAVSMAAFRAGRKTDSDLDSDLQRNLNRLSSMSSAGRLEYRVIDYLGPYVLYIFDPSTDGGHAIVRLANFRGSTFDRPMFELNADSDSVWFAYFRREFEAVWEAASPWPGSLESAETPSWT
jgi:hypothetical protein